MFKVISLLHQSPETFAAAISVPFLQQPGILVNIDIHKNMRIIAASKGKYSSPSFSPPLEAPAMYAT
jgi:hypothetical protein